MYSAFSSSCTDIRNRLKNSSLSKKVDIRAKLHYSETFSFLSVGPLSERIRLCFPVRRRIYFRESVRNSSDCIVGWEIYAYPSSSHGDGNIVSRMGYCSYFYSLRERIRMQQVRSSAACYIVQAIKKRRKTSIVPYRGWSITAILAIRELGETSFVEFPRFVSRRSLFIGLGKIERREHSATRQLR